MRAAHHGFWTRRSRKILQLHPPEYRPLLACTRHGFRRSAALCCTQYHTVQTKVKRHNAYGRYAFQSLDTNFRWEGFHVLRSLADGPHYRESSVKDNVGHSGLEKSAESSDLGHKTGLNHSGERIERLFELKRPALGQGNTFAPSQTSIPEQLANLEDTPVEATQPHREQLDRPTKGSGKRRREASFLRTIRQATSEDLEETLHHHAHHDHSVDKVQSILYELIFARHVQPQGRHYEALILSNCEPQQGSVAALRRVLEEMEREKIGIDHLILSAVLKVLSIHPDAELLASVLARMAEQWITASPDDTTHAILTYIRLNEFELALPHLTHLINTSPPIDNKLRSAVPQHLYQTFLYRLSSPAISDHTASLHLLYLITEHSLPLSPVCASYLLDNAAASLHLDLTLHLWRSHIDTSYIISSSGMCQNALLTAARGGSAELATKCGRILEKRAVEERARNRRVWTMRGENQGGGVGLMIEELEMVAEAYRGDRDEKGNPTIGWYAVNRVTKRIREFERSQSVAQGKQAGWRRSREVSRSVGGSR